MIYHVIIALPLMMTGSGIFFFLIIQGWRSGSGREKSFEMPRVVPNLAGPF